MAMALVGPEAADFVLKFGPVQPLDIVMKRNLIFVSYESSQGAGTWALSFDRNGILTNWTQMA